MAEPNDALDFVERALDGFLADAPDSHFQCGYLGALISVRAEGFGLGHDARSAAFVALLALQVNTINEDERTN